MWSLLQERGQAAQPVRLCIAPPTVPLATVQTAAGEKSKQALISKINGAPVQCEQKNRDKYGRVVGVCSARGEDLNGWLVEQGWAIAYRWVGAVARLGSIAI